MKLYYYDKETMRVESFMNLWSMMFVFVLLIFTAYFIGKNQCVQCPDKEENVTIIDVSKEKVFSPNELMAYIKQCGIMHPDIVFAQMVLESGNFTSKIFKHSNNLLGMKVAGSRPTTALGERFGHAYYKDWRSCVQDYALYQAAFLRKLKDREKYLHYLGENYAEDGSYVVKLRSILDTL